MSVSCCLFVDRSSQIQHLDDSCRTEIKVLTDDLRPAGIIKMLDLRRPIYKQTAAYGHFGRLDVELPWEKLDKADDLKKYLES